MTNSTKSILPVLLIAVTLFAAGCANRSQSGDSEEGLDMMSAMTAQYRKISPQMAKEMMDSQNQLIIIDVRTESEYNSGHIEGALLLPNEEISTEGRIDMLPDKHAVILVYCRSGNRSSQAARKLASLGYINVYDFGGLNSWPYEIVQ
ncbi:MAG: rhodanese-like domain-containing protein [Sphaerochaetaceae bacterium]|nr:rhodanese-like domain-containing protein [Sphaerochaetaceae bacterium]